MSDSTHDEDQEYIEQIAEFRQQKDQFFASSPQSPIPQGEPRKAFSGLTYFPPDPDLQIVAELVPFEEQPVVEIGTSTGDIQPQIRYGELRFHLGDQELRLVGFLDPDYQEQHHGHDHGVELFIPFRDATSGKETYGAGRYVEAQVGKLQDGRDAALLDFNLAYNPYCAYSESYSCPLPPAENTLPVPIRAGEKTYGEGH